MNLGFKTKLPDGSPSNFPAKILLCPEVAPTLKGMEVYDAGEYNLNRLREQGIMPKIHTIRNESFDRQGIMPRWIQGVSVIHFATGIRTKNYICFGTAVCAYVSEIKLYQNVPESPINIYVDEKHVGDVELFARNDGFDNYEAFHNWFSPVIQQAMKDDEPCYKGILIHWTNYKYN